MSSSSEEAHQESQQRIGYDTSARKWVGQGIATVSDRSGQVLLSVPIQFLSQGLVNNFGFVLQSIHMSYDVRDGQICSEEGVECNPLDAVTPGRFVYWNAETVCCRPRIGPRFKFMSRPPHAGDDMASTMSNSKRSSANQVCLTVDEARYTYPTPGCFSSFCVFPHLISPNFVSQW
uniref:Uncharacterized protein n=1 Tax=Melanopsichium pennsylvanicum 4 TaxID=1398559 RepID=A0A077RDP2_9BASI|nr:putative protein [Melanopsichium pennsylvanicum 4]